MECMQGDMVLPHLFGQSADADMMFGAIKSGNINQMDKLYKGWDQLNPAYALYLSILSDDLRVVKWVDSHFFWIR